MVGKSHNDSKIQVLKVGGGDLEVTSMSWLSYSLKGVIQKTDENFVIENNYVSSSCHSFLWNG